LDILRERKHLCRIVARKIPTGLQDRCSVLILEPLPISPSVQKSNWIGICGKVVFYRRSESFNRSHPKRI
jgi:hypothetical protein